MVARSDIVAEARRWLGTPYHHQASRIGVGADCLGLVRGVWRALIGPEPERPPAYTPGWNDAAAKGDPLLAAALRHFVAVDAAEARAGDVMLFRLKPQLPAKHAGILTESGTLVHAYEGSGVVETTLSPWWRRRLAGVFAFPGAD